MTLLLTYPCHAAACRRAVPRRGPPPPQGHGRRRQLCAPPRLHPAPASAPTASQPAKTRIKAPLVTRAADWFIHRDPSYWSRPDDFVPSRWAGVAPNAHGAHYGPFSKGLRGCPGQRAAFALMKGALADILAARELRAPREADRRPAPRFKKSVVLPNQPDELWVRFAVAADAPERGGRREEGGGDSQGGARGQGLGDGGGARGGGRATDAGVPGQRGVM